MLRDRVSSFWALEVACPRGGSNPPEPPFCSGASLAPCSSGDRRSPVPCSCSSWDTVTTNPNPFPTRCMRGDVYVAPGLPYGNRRR